MSEPDIRRGDIWWISLDPTQGSELKKTRPCVVISHDTLNQHRRTVVVVPLSTSGKVHPPITVAVKCQSKNVVAITDQVRAVAKHRLKSRIETMTVSDLRAVCEAVKAILDLNG